ncbi:bifunctional folylpolyglutamate synthase/dihydrofolate synthase [Niallia endozanthoxylica]|uniref:Dihydrofolate synthase/folylpolyglutamate synthase n=1 Tax=Niallia endozanthoxylica TaxID=2036016 RepID=A0A5J5HPK5_9BACI|nr:folylpolyglutamate synthase/dihydrofolate synthase family protein [Niallia endozanthoxylica]KAA9023146.1 bifunctional folylpolyglutamate synthase/dihydrofolate synthase [Niallia endozanthoxylica]
MFQTYEEALHWIHSRLRLGIKPGLMRMEWMMEKLNHPERRIKCIHIGGTNGKGSTVTYLRSILEHAGFQTGTFTSPYIEQFNERISLNGAPIADEEVVELANRIYPLSVELEATELGGPSEFEIITAMAIYYFAEVHPVDIVIFEVGLGGRFDSTNVIHPLLSIITNIGLDHTQFLGNSYEEIAFEKAGIIKKEKSIISAVKQPEAREVIVKRARELEAPIYLLNEDFSIKDHKSVESGEVFSWQCKNLELKDAAITMFGKHQTENAALAIMAANLLEQEHGIQIQEKDIREGLKAAFWPGRFEMVKQNPVLILDGAHNEEGITALTNELTKRYHDKKIKIIFSALADKKLDKMIEKLDKTANEITFVSFDYPRASTTEALYSLSSSKKKYMQDDWKDAITNEYMLLDENEILVVTGSLYFISQVRHFLRESTL